VLLDKRGTDPIWDPCNTEGSSGIRQESRMPKPSKIRGNVFPIIMEEIILCMNRTTGGMLLPLTST